MAGPGGSPQAENTQQTAPAPAEALRTGRDLDHALVSGIAWTAIAKWLSQILSWASTIVVANLLTPTDFGIVGMALVYLGLVQIVNDLGLGAAIVQNRGLTTLQLSRLYGLVLLFGLGLMLASMAAAWPVAAFFKNPDVRPVVMVLSVTLFLSSVQLVPRSLLLRELAFPQLAKVDGLQAVAGAAGTLLLALLGFGYWALVLGQVASTVLASALLVFKRPHAAAWPREVRELISTLKFGGHVILSSIGWYVYGNADSTVAGKLLGTASLGAYSMVASLATAPIVQVTGMLQRVTAGIFSATQSDHATLRRYVTGLLEASAFVIFPATFGLALVAPDFIPLVLGVQWHEAIVPLQILAVAASLRCLSPILTQALLFTGHPYRNSQITVAAAVVLPLLFILGARWGLPGIAAAWLVGLTLLIIPATLYYSRVHFGLRAGEFFGAIRAPAVCTAVMTIGVAGVEVLVFGTDITGVGLATQIVAGVLLYALALRALYWHKVSALRALISRARGGT